MAYPTQITIASGKTVYEGDPENDEGITSRQVQVSVTYQMERGDEDLLAVTERKAKEVDAAQEAAWRQVKREQTEMELPPKAEPPPHPTDEDDPLGGEPGEDDGQDPDGDWADDEPPSYGGNGEDHEDNHEGSHGGGGGPTPPPYRPAAAPQGPHACRIGPGNGTGHDASSVTGGVNGPQARAVTKPQKLALGAQARRLGLSDQALAEIIRERFGKSSFTPRYAVDRLTRAEAEALMRALSEREWESARADQPTAA